MAQTPQEISSCIEKDDSPAKWAVIREWDAWAPKHANEPSVSDGMNFFFYLQKQRPDLLNFRASGDKWQVVHAWLLRERRVKD